MAAIRVGWMFDIFSVLLIPQVIEKTFSGFSKYVSYLIVMGIAMMYMLYLLSANFHRVVPYYFYFTR